MSTNHNKDNSSRSLPRDGLPMPVPRPHSRFSASRSSGGHWLIAVGLAILILAAWMPALPVVTAMAILTLGATDATLARFRGMAAMAPVMLHAATYATLYALFVGATLHAANAASAAPLSGWTLFDLAASILPMGVAAQRIVGAVRQSREFER